jgi:hypothetical protein
MAEMCNDPMHGEAVFMVHNIPEAEVAGLCIDCMVGFSVAMLQQFAPEMLAAEPKKPRSKGKAAAAAAADGNGSGGETGDGDPPA